MKKYLRDSKEGFTLATLIIVNLSCMLFHSIYSTIDDSQTALQVAAMCMIAGLILMPLLYKSVVWVTGGYGSKVLSIPLFYLLFGLISAIELSLFTGWIW